MQDDLNPCYKLVLVVEVSFPNSHVWLNGIVIPFLRISYFNVWFIGITILSHIII